MIDFVFMERVLGRSVYKVVISYKILQTTNAFAVHSLSNTVSICSESRRIQLTYTILSQTRLQIYASSTSVVCSKRSVVACGKSSKL